MSSGTAMGISLTTITTDAQCPLGFIHTEPANQDNAGERQFIYVGISYAGAGSANVRVGDAFNKLETSAAAWQIYRNLVLVLAGTDAHANSVVGLSQQVWDWAVHYAAPAAADELFGFVQCKGIGQYVDDNSAVAGTGLIPGATAGELGTAAGTETGCATAITNGAIHTEQTAMIHCIG